MKLLPLDLVMNSRIDSTPAGIPTMPICLQDSDPIDSFYYVNWDDPIYDQFEDYSGRISPNI